MTNQKNREQIAEFSEKLRKFMRNSGLSCKDIAKKVGAAECTVEFWVRGQRYPMGERKRALFDLMANYKQCRSNNVIRTNTAKCRKTRCSFYCDSTYTCDYFLITGERRPCPPGDECTIPNRRKTEC